MESISSIFGNIKSVSSIISNSQPTLKHILDRYFDVIHKTYLGNPINS